MNMNTNSRLDDRFNALLVAVALAAVLGMNFSAFEGAALGRDGASAPALAKAAASAAPESVRVAAR